MSHTARAAAAPVPDANAHFPSIRRTGQQARIAPPRHRYHRHMTIPQSGHKTGHSGRRDAVSYSEIPLNTSHHTDEETLTIPAERMKGDKEHVVPLSKQAMEILRFADRKPRHSKGTIFPPKRGGIFIGRGRLSIITKTLELPFVPHGLRGSFANWASNHKNQEYKPLAKLSLAHVVDNKSDQAYFTDDPIDKRRAVLQDCSDFLAQTSVTFISPKDQDQDTDDMAGLEEAVINAVPGSDQQAGKPGNGTTATTAGQIPKRSNKASKPASVNGRTRKESKQSAQDLQKLLPIFAKTQT